MIQLSDHRQLLSNIHQKTPRSPIQQMANMRTKRRTRSLPAIEITVDINQFITLPPSRSLTVKAKIYVQNYSIYCPVSSQMYLSIPTYFAGLCLSPIKFSIENEITERYVTIKNTRKYISFFFDRLTLTSIKARPVINHTSPTEATPEDSENPPILPEGQEKTKDDLNSQVPSSPSLDKEKKPKPFQRQQKEIVQGETRQSPSLSASKESTPCPVSLNLHPLTEDEEEIPETRHSVATSAMTQSMLSASKKPIPLPSPVQNDRKPDPPYKQVMYPVALFSILTIAALVVSRSR